MATREELLGALRAADAAGDTQAAQAIARALQGSTPDLSGQTVAPGAGATLPGQGAPVWTSPVKLGKAGLDDILKNESTWNKFWGGVGSSVALPYQSVKQLLGMDVSPEDVAAQRTIASTGPGMAGNIAGSLAAFAVPGGKAIGGLEKAFGAGRAAKVLATPVISALEGGLLTPTVGEESRGWNAFKSALTASALQGGGAVLRRALTGAVTPSIDAKALMDKGIQPTVSQGGEGAMGAIVGGAENVARNVPIAGRWVKVGSERAHKELMEEAAKRAIPPGQTMIHQQPARGEFFTELRLVTDDAYDKVLKGKVIKLGGLTKGDVLNNAKRELTGVDPKYGNILARDIEALFPKKGANRISGENWKTLQTKIRERVREHAGSEGFEERALTRAYERVDKVLNNIRDRSMLPDDVAQLKAIDNAVGHAAILRKGASYASEGGKESSAVNLVRAVEALSPPQMKIENAARFQDITDPAKAVLDKEAVRDALSRRIAYGTAGGLMGVAGILNPAFWGLLGGSYGVGKAASTHGGAKFLMGGNQWQQNAAKLAEQLRKQGVQQGVISAIAGTEGQRE